MLRDWGDSALIISEAAMANPAVESIRKYLAIYAHFIAINVAVAPRRTGDLLSGGSLVLHISLAVCGKTGKFELLPFRYGALCWWFSRLARHKRLFLVSLRSSPMRQPISGCGSGCRR